MDICLRMLKESSKSSTATLVGNSVLIISHNAIRDCRVHVFSDNLSRNSWIRKADALKTYAVSKCPKRQLTLYTSNMIIGKCINSRQYLRLSPENPNGQGFLTVLPFSVLIQEIFFNNSLSQYSPLAFPFITSRAENNLLDFKSYQL